MSLLSNRERVVVSVTDKSQTPDSSWDFGEQKEDPIHRIHSYPARFPAFIATKALRYAEGQGVNVDVVADVFCGCGTTAVEARRNGKEFWGCDINPVATLIAQVKTRRYDDMRLAQYFDAIRDEFSRTKITPAARAQISDRIRYWFNQENMDDLVLLDQAIRRHTPVNSSYRKFFLCAFSNILKPTSRWLTKSIKAQIDPDKTPRRVFDTFKDQFALMRNANAQDRFPAAAPPVSIRTRNFLAARKPACRADLIVTSPPYVTSYDYASIHQLSTLWLGFAQDYRLLRTNMVGNQYGAETLAAATIASLGGVASQAYRNLLHADRYKANSVARYFLDIDRTVGKCGRMLNERAMALFVIGNTQYGNIEINNAQHLLECMERRGFRHMEIIERKISSKIMTPYRDARGRFTRDSTQHKVYGKEFIVIGRAA